MSFPSSGAKVVTKGLMIYQICIEASHSWDLPWELLAQVIPPLKAVGITLTSNFPSSSKLYKIATPSFPCITFPLPLPCPHPGTYIHTTVQSKQGCGNRHCTANTKLQFSLLIAFSVPYISFLQHMTWQFRSQSVSITLSPSPPSVLVTKFKAIQVCHSLA